jgi:mono/diheme cytochrome c family protein
MTDRVPRWVIATTAVIVSLSLVPLALVARARAKKSDQPRVHLVMDMDDQPKFKAQSANAMFADGRAMRPPVPGTIARGTLEEDEHFFTGKINGEWAMTFPMPVTDAVMQRGQQRFNIYCAVCHGLVGDGNGMINKRALELEEGTWVPAASFHTETIRARPVGNLFYTITYGVRTMPSYGEQILPADRWAIVAYLRALQRSQQATIQDVPADVRPNLR